MGFVTVSMLQDQFKPITKLYANYRFDLKWLHMDGRANLAGTEGIHIAGEIRQDNVVVVFCFCFSKIEIRKQRLSLITVICDADMHITQEVNLIQEY